MSFAFLDSYKHPFTLFIDASTKQSFSSQRPTLVTNLNLFDIIVPFNDFYKNLSEGLKRKLS